MPTHCLLQVSFTTHQWSLVETILKNGHTENFDKWVNQRKNMPCRAIRILGKIWGAGVLCDSHLLSMHAARLLSIHAFVQTQNKAMPHFPCYHSSNIPKSHVGFGVWFAFNILIHMSRDIHFPFKMSCRQRSNLLYHCGLGTNIFCTGSRLLLLWQISFLGLPLALFCTGFSPQRA